MPIDPSIPLAAGNIPQGPNPLQIQGQVGQIHAQQQEAQLRSLQIQQAQQQAQADAALIAATQAPGLYDSSGALIPSEFIRRVQGTPGVLKVQDYLDKNATYQKTLADAHKAQWDAQEKLADGLSQIGGEAESYARDSGQPTVAAAHIAARLGELVNRGMLPMPQASTYLLPMMTPDGNVDPSKVSNAINVLKAASPALQEKRAQADSAVASAQNALAEATNRGAELPGLRAKSALEQQVTAGSVGGITPQEQQQNALRGREVTTAEQRLATEAPHIAAETTLARANATKAGIEAAQLQALGPGSAGTGIPDVPVGQKNDAYLQSLNAGMAANVKALSEGRMQFPSGRALQSPYWQSMLQAVAKYDPSFDAINYNARAKTRQDFTSGKSAQQVNALNTVVGHLSDLSDAADALNNTPVPFVNSVKNFVGSALGSPQVTNFETAKQAVADELTRVYRQAGGSEADIKSWQQSLGAANSPAQLHGAFNTIGNLLESKLSAMQNQYQQGMGTNDVQMITPAARVGLDKLENKARAAAPQSAPKASLPRDGATATINGRPAVWKSNGAKGPGWYAATP